MGYGINSSLKCAGKIGVKLNPDLNPCIRKMTLFKAIKIVIMLKSMNIIKRQSLKYCNV